MVLAPLCRLLLSAFLPFSMHGQMGSGYVYKKSGAWHLQFYQNEKNAAGELVQVRRSKKLCEVKGVTQKHVNGLAAAEMAKVETRTCTTDGMPVTEFWEHRYLPYCEKEWKGTGMRASTVRGFKQVWRQHLKGHFGKITLQEYTADKARKFLSSLKTKQGKNTLKHIRALASAMFSEAVERNIRADNPWHVKLPKDCKETKATEHYTMEEAENLISVLIDHVDAQLVIALSCFLGLGPAEISGLQWGDVDPDWINIRRNKPSHGKVGPPKTKERMAPLPIIPQVRIFVELWRGKCEDTAPGAWVIVDLPNMVNRVIKPHVMGGRKCEWCEKTPKASGVPWKGLYAGRRGAVTAIIEATGGNYAVAQAIARHKSMTTTLNVYKKQITPQGLLAGWSCFRSHSASSGGFDFPNNYVDFAGLRFAGFGAANFLSRSVCSLSATLRSESAGSSSESSVAAMASQSSRMDSSRRRLDINQRMLRTTPIGHTAYLVGESTAWTHHFGSSWGKRFSFWATSLVSSSVLPPTS
jgi:integrase